MLHHRTLRDFVGASEPVTMACNAQAFVYDAEDVFDGVTDGHACCKLNQGTGLQKLLRLIPRMSCSKRDLHINKQRQFLICGHVAAHPDAYKFMVVLYPRSGGMSRGAFGFRKPQFSAVVGTPLTPKLL
jgi:hypothetical protein